jgi:serine/threonine-protein kinase
VDASLAPDGTLAYVSGAGSSAAARTLVWVDRQLRETDLATPSRAYYFPRVSPDGTRIAVQVRSDQNMVLNIWVWDLARMTLTRVTSAGSDVTPVWTSDSSGLLFSSSRAGAFFNVFKQAADGAGVVERLTESPHVQVASDVSPDSSRAVLTERSSTTGDDVMTVSLDGKHQVLPLLQTPFNERNGIISPNGHWLAYEADDSGSFEIHVRPFPDVNSGHWQVSTSGGIQPLWARDGSELFYVAPDGSLMRVAVTGGSAWTAGAPTKLLEGRYIVSEFGLFQRNYDITADGQRFLMIKAVEATSGPPQIVVVQHFDEELKRLVPTR